MAASGRYSRIVPVDDGGSKFDPRFAAIKYDPEYCITIRKLAQDGKFPETWCAVIGVTLQTLYNWSNAYPEFEEAMHISWHVLHHYWTEEAAKCRTGEGNRAPSVVLEILRKRFPATYGKNPRFTHEHFTQRNEVAPNPKEEQSSTAGTLSDDPEARSARIAELMKRRAESQP